MDDLSLLAPVLAAVLFFMIGFVAGAVFIAVQSSKEPRE